MRPFSLFTRFVASLLASCASPTAMRGLPPEVTKTGAPSARVLANVTDGPSFVLDGPAGGTERRDLPAYGAELNITIHLKAPTGATADASGVLRPCTGNAAAVFEVSMGTDSVDASERPPRCDR